MNVKNYGELYFFINNGKRKRKVEYLAIASFFIFAYIIFVSNSYKNGIRFLIVTTTIVVIFLIFYIKRYIFFIKKFKYIDNLLEKDIKELSEELEYAEYNKEKEFILLKNYYIDTQNISIIKFNDVIQLYKKTKLESFPPCYGLNQYVCLIMSDSTKINVINWSFSRFGPEDDLVYDIFKERCKNSLIK